MTARPAALLVVTLALAGGCGGDDDTTEADTEAPTTESPTTTTDPDEAVEAAAHAFADALFEWDAATIDEDFDAILELATGPFAVEAEATFADDATRDALRDNRASERLTDVEVHIESVDGDHAEVFLTAEVAAINEDYARPRSDSIRAEVGLALVDGEWLVEDLTLLDGLSLGLPD